jgi:hypothetical protein
MVPNMTKKPWTKKKNLFFSFSDRDDDDDDDRAMRKNKREWINWSTNRNCSV